MRETKHLHISATNVHPAASSACGQIILCKQVRDAVTKAAVEAEEDCLALLKAQLLSLDAVEGLPRIGTVMDANEPPNRCSGYGS
jgi:hypothetical protein